MKALAHLFLGFFTAGLLAAGTAAAASSEAPRVNSAGGVTVKVTLLRPDAGDETRFAVALDTHAVNLDVYDLKTLALLRDDMGKTYAPTRVENKGAGHHRESTVVFPKVDPGAKRLELVVKDIAGVKERSFVWDL